MTFVSYMKVSLRFELSKEKEIRLFLVVRSNSFSSYLHS